MPVNEVKTEEVGFEPSAPLRNFIEKQDVSKPCAVNAPVVNRETPLNDPDLRAIVDAWAGLSDDVKRTIAGVVRLSVGKG